MTADHRDYYMGEGQVVTLIVAAPEGPVQVDVAMSFAPLDTEDPRQPGDVIFHGAADTGQEHQVLAEAFTTGLELVVRALREAQP